MDLEVDFEARHRRVRRPRGVGAVLSAADRLRSHARRRPAAAGREFEERVLARRREYAILRVDRADLSKNVLRGFTAFDIFLEQHPEFAERITFTAQLMPSRTDVPEYAEYLEKIEALVAVVNHRHGTPDWMPIDLKLRDDLDEAVASYKHYDVMMVNAMFDGMNLVAKEGPLVNERHGVSILSENTGAHEELGEFALSVNPFDVQELADALYSALMMSPEARERRANGLKQIVTSRDPGDWIDEQIADIRAKAGTSLALRPRLAPPPRTPNSRPPRARGARRSPPRAPSRAAVRRVLASPPVARGRHRLRLAASPLRPGRAPLARAPRRAPPSRAGPRFARLSASPRPPRPRFGRDPASRASPLAARFSASSRLPTATAPCAHCAFLRFFASLLAAPYSCSCRSFPGASGGGDSVGLRLARAAGEVCRAGAGAGPDTSGQATTVNRVVTTATDAGDVAHRMRREKVASHASGRVSARAFAHVATIGPQWLADSTSTTSRFFWTRP